MTDAPNSLLVHCGWCRHEWLALKLPMPIAEAAELAEKMHCPMCAEGAMEIFTGPALVDANNTSAERVKKTGES